MKCIDIQINNQLSGRNGLEKVFKMKLKLVSNYNKIQRYDWDYCCKNTVKNIRFSIIKLN